MCSLPPPNSPGSARSVALPSLAVIRSLPLATGLGLSLTIGLLHSSRAVAQAVSNQEIAQLSTAEASAGIAAASAQHLLFVSPIVGNDTSADGSQRSPFRTITQALQVAQDNTVILLTPGTYSTDSGEVFPLMVKPGVILQGDLSTRGRGIVIRGGGAFLSPTSAGQNIAILAENQAQLLGVTVTNPHPRGYGVWVESGSPVIANSTFTGSAAMLVQESARPVLRDNTIESGQQAVQSAAMIRPTPPQITSTAAAQAVSIQSSRAPAAASPPPLPITERPPSTIATRPPGYHPASIASSAAPSSNAAASAINSSANSARASAATAAAVRSTPAPEMRVSPPAAARPAIVPIAQSRTLQPVAEISVPPPDTALRPAVVDRSPTAIPPPAPAAAAVTPVSTSVNRAQTAAPLRTLAVSRSAPSRLRSTASRPVASPAPTPIPAARAIDIPVPPPENSPENSASATPLAYAPRPASAATSGFNRPIDIPVPLPESSTVGPAAVRTQNLSPPRSENTAPSADLLPVPSGDAPVGNVGDLPRITVASTQMGGMYFASSQMQSDFRYRVVVDANSVGMQSLVQSIIPDAFLTSINGQSLMQVGAFNSRDNAEQAVQMLNQNGLLAVIQEIE